MKYSAMLMFIAMCLLSCQAPVAPVANTTTTAVRSDGVYLTDYGADPTGKADASTAFVRALSNSAQRVIVPKGTYRVDKMIEVRKQIFLEAGATIIRNKESGNSEPIFWLSKSFASITGSDKSATIRTLIPIPEGMIKIGHLNQGWKNRNVQYCQVSSLFLLGPNTSEANGNVAVMIHNSQEKGQKNVRVSYFHTLWNLVIQQFDTAIHLRGPANANSISNIILNRIGEGAKDYAIVLEGAQENRIYDIHHHHSPGSTTFLLDSYRGFDPVFNNISAVVSEPGGQGRCLEARTGAYNNINIGCNTKKGIIQGDSFKGKKNKIGNY